MNRQVSAGATVLALVVMGKLATLVRDVALSSTFGASLKTDAYFIANGVSMLVFSALYSTILLVFLPIYSKIKSTDDARQGYLFANNFIGVAFFVTAILTTITIWLSPELIDLIAANASAETKTLAVVLARIFSVSFLFTVLVGTLTAIQQAQKSFLGSQLIPVINHGIVIFAILVFSQEFGIVAVACSAVFAWLIQIPFQKALIRPKFVFRPTLNFKDPSLREFGKLCGPAFMAMLLCQASPLVDIYLSSGLETGFLSALNYAMRLMLSIGLLLPGVIATVMYPYFSDQAAVQDRSPLIESIARTFRIVVLSTLPLALYALVFSHDIVSVVFGRGEFGPRDVALSSKVFFLYSTALVFIGVREILNKVFFSLQLTSHVFWISLVSVSINIALSLALVEHYSIFGLAAATSISIFLFVILQMGLLARTLGREIFSGMRPLASRALFSSVIFIGAALTIKEMVVFASPILYLFVSFFVPSVLYILFLSLSGQPEATVLVESVLRRRKKGGTR
jgi:putative peptidoglycan lipid II flippase